MSRVKNLESIFDFSSAPKLFAFSVLHYDLARPIHLNGAPRRYALTLIKSNASTSTSKAGVKRSACQQILTEQSVLVRKEHMEYCRGPNSTIKSISQLKPLRYYFTRYYRSVVLSNLIDLSFRTVAS